VDLVLKWFGHDTRSCPPCEFDVLTAGATLALWFVQVSLDLAGRRSAVWTTLWLASSPVACLFIMVGYPLLVPRRSDPSFENMRSVDDFVLSNLVLGIVAGLATILLECLVLGARALLRWAAATPEGPA
jgi:hypothetical protein